jgi:aminoglycoside 6'-N-acetyltransferase I
MFLLLQTRHVRPQTAMLTSMPNHTIDDFSRDFLDAAVRLFVTVFNAAPWNDSWTQASAGARLRDVVDTPGFVGVGLTDGEELCGFAIGHTERWFTGRHFLLQEMCVRTDLQRRGMGTELVNALERRLAGVERVYLLTDRQSPAHAFYERSGFHSAGRQVVMVKAMDVRPSDR